MCSATTLHEYTKCCVVLYTFSWEIQTIRACTGASGPAGPIVPTAPRPFPHRCVCNVLPCSIPSAGWIVPLRSRNRYVSAISFDRGSATTRPSALSYTIPFPIAPISEMRPVAAADIPARLGSASLRGVPERAASAVISGYNCDTTAECEFIPFQKHRRRRHTGITLPWPDLDDANNCGGRLPRGICRASWVSQPASSAVSDAGHGAAEICLPGLRAGRRTGAGARSAYCRTKLEPRPGMRFIGRIRCVRPTAVVDRFVAKSDGHLQAD